MLISENLSLSQRCKTFISFLIAIATSVFLEPLAILCGVLLVKTLAYFLFWLTFRGGIFLHLPKIIDQIGGLLFP